MKKTQRASSSRPTGKAKAGGSKARSSAGRPSTPVRIPVRGASKSGANKSGASKSAANKSGAGKSGPGKFAAGKSGPGKSGMGKSGRSRVTSRAAAEAARPRVNEAEVSETRALAIAAMDAALDRRALEPVLIDVSAMGSYTDFIGIVSGRSDRQVDAIAEHVCQELKLRGLRVLGQEGGGNGRWTLLDFGAFVIHVFYHPVREFYDLESLWIEAPRVKLDVPPEATLSQSDALYGAL